MTALLYLPALLQAASIAVDEFIFHHRRGLKRWERLGHPLDTATVLLSYLLLDFCAPSSQTLMIFIGLATVSSLFVTKDEWVHKQECGPHEQWLHSLLFVLHPTAFFAAGFLWWQHEGANFFLFQTLALAGFMIYQIVYWSFNVFKKTKAR